jgi:hypothetical protein
METWRHGDMETKTWKQEDIDMRHGNLETSKNRDVET